MAGVTRDGQKVSGFGGLQSRSNVSVLKNLPALIDLCRSYKPSQGTSILVRARFESSNM